MVLFVVVVALGLLIYSSSELAGGHQKVTDDGPVEEKGTDAGPVENVKDANPVENVGGEMAFEAAGDIWIMNADGSKPMRITQDQDPPMENTPTFSPDGEKVAFVQEIVVKTWDKALHKKVESTAGQRVVVMDVDSRNQVKLPVPEVPSDEYPSVREPSWTPDGRRIAFMAYSQPSYMSGCDQHVFITNADGSGTPRRFPIPGLSGCPSRTPLWSPDGSQIAFEASGKDSRPDIYVMGVSPEGATGRLRLLTPDYLDGAEDPSWSPDGTEIAFSGGRSGYHAPGKGYAAIFKIDVNSLEETRLTKGSSEHGFSYDTSPTWSPDGQNIAYLREASETSSIYVVDSDGSASTLVRKLPALTRSPDWRKQEGVGEQANHPQHQGVSEEKSHGQEHVVFEETTHVQPQEGESEETPHSEQQGGVGEVPNDKLTACGSGDSQQAAPNRELNGKIAFVSQIYASTSTSPNVSASVSAGENASVASAGSAGPDVVQGHYDLCVIDADGTGLTRITNTPEEERSPLWSPDGDKIAFLRTPGGIYVANADGSDQAKLSWSGSAMPGAGYVQSRQWAWSPDGRTFAYTSSCDLYIAPADGSGTLRKFTLGRPVRVLDPTPNYRCLESPTWSPDGKHIAFTNEANRGDGPYVMNVSREGDTHQARKLTNHFQGSPSWSPDGSEIAFVGSNKFDSAQIYKIDVSSLKKTPLTEGIWPTWSPDGEKIAFVGTGGINVMDADGSNVTPVFDSAGVIVSEPVWQPLP